MKCINDPKCHSPDWGGYFICIGCGKVICYPCQHEHCVEYLEKFETCYYDDPKNETEGCHGSIWYLCHDCLLNPPTKEIMKLISMQNALKLFEEAVISQNKDMDKFVKETFKSYEGYFTDHRASCREIHVKVIEDE